MTDFDSINNKIRPFFDKYQLRGTKYLDYLDWLSAIKIMEIKLHLKEEGFSKILSIKDKMNQNRNHFQDYQPPHTIIQNKSYLEINPNYISGFITGDGYLSLISKKDSPSFGRISFGANQHINNKSLIESIAH